jgi:hypothetical protein
MAEPALRVHRAVDRVDHDPRRGVAERPLAELLGDEQELLSLPVQFLESGDHSTLGRLVDRGRVVAADAAGEHRLSLDARRQLVEDTANVRGRGPAELEPGRHSVMKSSPERSLG